MKWTPHYIAHLTKRTWHSYRARPLTPEEKQRVADVLLPGELGLWERFPTEDQRHSYVVFIRFQERCPTALVEHSRAALLHDIGKIVAPLSTTLRVIATFVGPRTAAFRTYHDHEAIGLELLEAVSHHETLRVLKAMYDTGSGDSPDPVVSALYDADNL
jgi:hypothetical protein